MEITGGYVMIWLTLECTMEVHYVDTLRFDGGLTFTDVSCSNGTIMMNV